MTRAEEAIIAAAIRLVGQSGSSGSNQRFDELVKAVAMKRAEEAQFEEDVYAIAEVFRKENIGQHWSVEDDDYEADEEELREYRLDLARRVASAVTR